MRVILLRRAISGAKICANLWLNRSGSGLIPHYRRWARPAGACQLMFTGRCLYSTSSRIVEHDVKKFGGLEVSTGSTYNVSIVPISPQVYPDQNRAFVEVHDTRNSNDGPVVNCSTAGESSSVAVTVNSVERANEQCQKSPSCVIAIPLKYDVVATVTGDQTLSITSMQNEFIQLATENGDCSMSDVQTRVLTAKTSGGSILSSGLLQGNVALETLGKGKIQLFKPLCSHLVIRTDHGDVTISNMYADQSTISTNCGNIVIQNAHRSVAVNISNEGNLTINSLDGHLHAMIRAGSASILLSRDSSVNVVVEQGNIVLKVPHDLTNCLFDFTAGQNIHVDSQLDQSSLERTESNGLRRLSGVVKATGKDNYTTLLAQTEQGDVSVICQDWLSSIGFDKFRALADGEDEK